jgi:uncharacterized protein
MKKIVALAGEGEYESDRTMRPVVDQIGSALGAEVIFRTPDPLEDMPKFPPSSFGNLDILAEADLLILFTRFRILPADEMAAIAGYLARGGPLLALRTSTHAFRPIVNSSWYGWSERFGAEILGSPWSRHHGHDSTTKVSVVSSHPIVADLPEEFHVSSWLYEANPAPDSHVLLWGDPIHPEDPVVASPVAWIRERQGQRVFYTSLGSQEDLKRPEVRAVLVRAAQWCTCEEDPEGTRVQTEKWTR